MLLASEEAVLDRQLDLLASSTERALDDERDVETAWPAASLLDEVLVRFSLVNHHVALVLLDHVLDVVSLVTGKNCEAVSLTTDKLILRQRHQDAAAAPLDLSALAGEVKLVRRISPACCALAESRNLLIHRPQQRLVPSLPLEPLLHKPRSYASLGRSAGRAAAPCGHLPRRVSLRQSERLPVSATFPARWRKAVTVLERSPFSPRAVSTLGRG